MNYNPRTIALAYTPHISRAMALLGAVAALCFFLYGFFLLEAVAHTANRTQAERQINDLTSKLSTLEEQYLSATRTMTLERARELGYVTPKDVSTVYVNDSTHGLSMRTQ